MYYKENYVNVSVDNNTEAHLSINNNRLKQYGDKYYLNDGDEFQIELTNNSFSRVLVKIKLNGQFISSSGLVLDPGTHHYLDRYIDSDRKFKFKTFEVDDVEETKRARERNGKVEILFYEEIPTQNYPHIRKFDNFPNSGTGSGTFFGDLTYTTSANSITFSNSSSSNTARGFAKNINLSNISQTETGRVDEGSRSDQSFRSTSGNFSPFPSNTVRFQILPQSQKPREFNELREYCSECGLRLRKRSWKFCPQCGHKL